MVTHFIIIFEGRTGSSFVTSSLQSHPNVIAIDEPLVGKTALEQKSWITSFFKNPHSAFGVRKRVKDCVLRAKKAPIAAAGFKTKLRNVKDREEFCALIQKYECKIIHLDRKNIIKQALSGLNALRLFDERGHYNLLKGEAPLPPFSPTVTAFEDEIRSKQEKNEALNIFLKNLKLPIIKLYYEEILTDQDVFFSKLLEFIDVAPKPMESKLAKNSNNDMRQVLLNYEEIKEYFSARGYKEMFDD